MTSKTIQTFMEDTQISLNKFSKNANIGASNISRILKGVTALTEDMAIRIAVAYPSILTYIGDEEERRKLQVSILPKKYMKEEEVKANESYFKLLVPEMRKQFNSMAPYNIDFLPQLNISIATADQAEKDSMIVVQVVETDLAPRIEPGDLVRAVEIKKEDYSFTQGIVMVVYSTYTVIKRILENNIKDEKGDLVLAMEGSAPIKVEYKEIKQMLQVDKIVQRHLSI